MNGILIGKNKNKKKVDKNRSILGLAYDNDAGDLKKPDLQEVLKQVDLSINGTQAENVKSAAPAPKVRQERRRQRRASAKILVRIRPADNDDPRFEEVLATSNASRANLYVITTSRNYYKMMRLRVTFPFDSAHDNDSSPEETAQVVRLDHLPNGRTGVAIQLKKAIHSPSQTYSTSSASLERSASEQRFTLRHPFSASAIVVDTTSNTRLQARCSDLSVAGCYIDTLNPFPKGSRAVLQLSYNDVNFVALAQVITHHIGMGMGLAFEKLAATQKAILADWLCSRAASNSVATEDFQASKLTESSEEQESSERELLLKMIRLLESTGKLMPL